MSSMRNTMPQAQQWVTTHTDTYDAISPSKDLDLSHISVFITGATSGIGRAIACRLALSGCCKIGVSGRNPGKLAATKEEVLQVARQAGHSEPQVLALELDVTSEQSVKAAAAAAEEAFGGSLDVFIANAGHLAPWTPTINSNILDWWNTWNVNILGTHLCAKHFVPLLLHSEIKTFLALSSVGALSVAPGASAYQTTKFAVCRYIEHLHSEEAESGLICIAVHPGGVKTALALSLPREMHEEVLIDTPELAADAMIWLVRERREWLSGRWVSAKWDVQELEAQRDVIVQQDLLKFRLQLE